MRRCGVERRSHDRRDKQLKNVTIDMETAQNSVNSYNYVSALLTFQ